MSKYGVVEIKFSTTPYFDVPYTFLYKYNKRKCIFVNKHKVILNLMINKDLPELLEDISALVEKYQKHKNFNIFNVMRVETDEVKTHSAIICELLNPKGSHQLGDKFLHLFLEQIIPEIECENLMETKTIYEKLIGSISKKQTEGGRIDILIEHPKFIVCIENKINAGDQPYQLRRYHNFLSKKKKQKFLLYLTIHGKEANVNSVCNSKFSDNNWTKDCDEQLTLEKDYYCISYSNDILTWLEKCNEIASENIFFQNTLKQYIDLINKITNRMHVKEILKMKQIIGNKNNPITAKKLIDNWIHIRWHTEDNFWRSFEGVISKKFSIIELQKFSNDYLNRAIHSKKNRKTFYGLHFIIAEEKDYNICLSIERGFDNVFYGVTLRKKNSNEWMTEQNLFNNYFKIIESINKEFKKRENWVAYKDFCPEVNFEEFSNETTLKLINSGYCTEIVKKYWNEVKMFIDEFLQKLEASRI